ncbi:MAG: hypothetical protein Q8R82_04470 [Hyphomonadaceae bacterium]|nr:hypothetical protein [Hyphomonadaceae bacterium]
MTCMDTESESPGGLNLAERIRRLANGRNTIDVAQFQFIGLEAIRNRYADRWSEKRDRVARIARQFIARRIAAEDVLIAGADGFLLVFGTFTGFLADAAAHRISKELNAFFLGSPDLDDMQIEAQHQSMSVDDFANAFGAMIAGSKDLAAPAPVRTAPAEIPMGFTPVWDAQRGALSTFFISPLDPATGWPMDWNYASHRHTDMDELKLKASEEAMRKLFASGKKALVGVAVHVSSLNSQQSLSRLMGVISKFDPALARYRVIRVSCVEPGYPRIYLEDILRVLKPRIPYVAIGLNWSEPDVASVLNLKPAAIGFTLPTGALGVHGPKADAFARIHAATEHARHVGVSVGVEGDLLPDHAQRFAQDGVNHVCSPRIWPTRRTLPPAEIWPASRLGMDARAETAA